MVDRLNSIRQHLALHQSEIWDYTGSSKMDSWSWKSAFRSNTETWPCHNQSHFSPFSVNITWWFYALCTSHDWLKLKECLKGKSNRKKRDLQLCILVHCCSPSIWPQLYSHISALIISDLLTKEIIWVIPCWAAARVLCYFDFLKHPG